MTHQINDSAVSSRGKCFATDLNQDCHCISLDRTRLKERLASDLTDRGLPEQLTGEASFLFSDYPVFLWEGHIRAMESLIATVETVIHSKPYQELIRDRSGTSVFGGKNPDHPAGVLFSYDFHLDDTGPQLIEINTNAGGVLLNHYLAAAQKACCNEIQALLPHEDTFHAGEQDLAAMFRAEFNGQHPDKELKTIAILDDSPETQFLYPEFLLFKTLFEKQGIKAFIADPKDLVIQNGNLLVSGEPVDLIYNRLTDFYLEEPGHQTLAQAFNENRAVITPSPLHYALYADKRNLTILSDAEMLTKMGLEDSSIQLMLSMIPRSIPVNPGLWETRKDWFFKPAQGYGSKGSYKGAKVTRKVFEEIVRSDYIAQKLVSPGERQLIIDDKMESLKVDIRCVTYRGRIQQVSARLYRGQTTNMRTRGGGLATVFPSPDEPSDTVFTGACS